MQPFMTTLATITAPVRAAMRPAARLLMRVADAGVALQPDPGMARRVAIANRVTLVLILVCLNYNRSFSAIGLSLGQRTGVLMGIGALVISLVLNARGLFTAARLLVFTFTVAVMVNFRTSLNFRGDANLFYAWACLPLVLCDIRERALVVYGVGLTIVSVLVLKVYLEPRMGEELLSVAQRHSQTLTAIPMTFVVLLSSVMFFVVSNVRAEQKLKTAYAAVQRLLDSVDQGFVTLDRHGAVQSGRSTVFNTWFGTPADGTLFADCLERLDENAASLFRCGWMQIEDDVLPPEIAIDQMPSAARANGRHYRLAYKPEMGVDNRIVSLLVVMTDITADVEREQAEANQKELINLVARFSSDQEGFRDFMREADALVGAIASPTVGGDELTRAIHTLKGNCALFGAQVVAQHCHEFETRIAEMEGGGSDLDRRALGAVWSSLRERVGVFVGNDRDSVSIDRAELESVRQHLRSGATVAECAATLDTWTWELAAKRLSRIGDHARSIARRLGRAELDVVIDSEPLCFEPERWSSFWTSFSHIVGNGVDHGIEPADERVRLGKPERGQITVGCQSEGRQVLISFGDDGRGIDWAAVKGKAEALGIAHDTRADLVAALFHDGLSTRSEVSATSGRGVGLAAVRAECERLGGAIEVLSEPRRGTTFRFRFPGVGLARRGPMLPRPSLAMVG